MERFCRWFGQAQDQRISTSRLQKGRALARRTRDPHTPLKQYRVQWGQLACVSRVDEFMMMDARRHPGCCRAVCPSWGRGVYGAKLQLVKRARFGPVIAYIRLLAGRSRTPWAVAVTKVEGTAQTSSRTRSAELAAFREFEKIFPLKATSFTSFSLSASHSRQTWVIPSHFFTIG
jgi:hypothetical protein